MNDPLFEKRILGKNGGYVDIHINCDKNKKSLHIKVSKILAEKGHQIILMPEININDRERRLFYFPELEENNASNPDARFNGILGDYKLPDNKFISHKSIQNAISATARKKVSICAIGLLNKYYSTYEILSAVRGSLINVNVNKSIKQVWVFNNDKSVIIIPRKIITNKNFWKIINTL